MSPAVSGASVARDLMRVAAMIYREDLYMGACVPGIELALHFTLRSEVVSLHHDTKPREAVYRRSGGTVSVSS
jgi:hypothetical protein